MPKAWAGVYLGRQIHAQGTVGAILTGMSVVGQGAHRQGGPSLETAAVGGEPVLVAQATKALWPHWAVDFTEFPQSCRQGSEVAPVSPVQVRHLCHPVGKLSPHHKEHLAHPQPFQLSLGLLCVYSYAAGDSRATCTVLCVCSC